MAFPYEMEYLFGGEHWHPFQVLSVDPMLFENLAIASEIYLFQPQANILKQTRDKIWNSIKYFLNLYTFNSSEKIRPF